MSLISWYPLNGDLKDKGLYGYDLINSNEDVIISNENGKIGHCYEDLTTSYAYLEASNPILFTGAHSMFCWVCPEILTSESSLDGVLGNHIFTDSNPSNTGITLRYVSATTYKVSLNTVNTSNQRTYATYYGDTELNINEWHHIGFTYDGTKIRIYVDGKVDKEVVYNNMKFSSQKIRIFSWSNAMFSSTYTGKKKINDVRIYDHCLSNIEVKELAKGKVCHYTFDEADVELVSDNSGFGYNGIPSEGTGFSSEDKKRGANSILIGGARHIELSHGNLLKVFNQEDFTISCWIKYEGSDIGTSPNYIYYFGLDNNRLQVLITEDGNLQFDFCENSLIETEFNFVTNINNWTHIACVAKNKSMFIYINGELIASNDSTNWKTVDLNDVIAYIGHSNNEISYPYGKMDDFRIYSTALSDDDIKELYQPKIKVDKNANIFCSEYIEENNELDLFNLNNGINTLTITAYNCGANFDWSNYANDKTITATITSRGTNANSGFYIYTDYNSYSSLIQKKDGFYYYVAFDIKASKRLQIGLLGNERVMDWNYTGKYITTEWQHFAWFQPSNSNDYASTDFFFKGNSIPLNIGDKIYVKNYKFIRISPEIASKFAKNGIVNTQHMIEEINKTSIFGNVIEANQIIEI